MKINRFINRVLLTLFVGIVYLGLVSEAYAQDYYDWSVRTDRHGKPAGYFAETPFPITETTTSYTIMNDEYPAGRTFYLGTKYYVDGGYTEGSNDGSWERPWTTINDAQNNVGEGNATIIVRGAHDGFDGVYNERIRFVSGIDDTHRWMITGYGQERPILEYESKTGESTVYTWFATDVNYSTIQRFKIQNNYANGIRTASIHDYINVIDVWLYNNCKWDPEKVNSDESVGGIYEDGNLYFLSSDNCWIFHTTSERSGNHGFKVGDDADNNTVEWSVAKETGYWEGTTILDRSHGSQGGPVAFDFPNDGVDTDQDGVADYGDNLIIRYNIIITSCVYGVQLRHTPNFSFHHNEIYNTIHYGDVNVDHGIGAHQVIIFAEHTYGDFYSNIIRDPGPNVEGEGTSGIYISSCIDPAGQINVYNNLVYGHDDSSIKVNVGNDNAIINIYNNTLYGANPGTYGVKSDAVIFTQDDVNLWNNIIYQGGQGKCIEPSLWVDAVTQHSHNLYYAPNGQISTSSKFTFDAATEIDSDPLFINAAAKNFELQPTSPAINMGTDVGLTHDFNGNPAPESIAFDIGAFEFQFSDSTAPTITSVSISPNSGTITNNDSVIITVAAGNNEAGLTPSSALINGRSIPLTDQGDGTYTGTYIVYASDNQGVNIEASNITLTDFAGNESEPASSTGSTLNVATTPVAPPTITSVTISPNSGTISVGDSVIITVTAGDNEAGLMPSDATINGKQVSLNDQGNGTYAGVYTVTQGDNDGTNIEATNITLTGEGGPSDPASSSGSTLVVDGSIPTIGSITISPNSGVITPGEQVTITVTAGGNEAGLIPSDAIFVGKSVSLYDQGDGTYTGAYTIVASDSEEVFAGNSLFNDDFETGYMSYWTGAADSSLAKTEADKLGSYGLSHNIQSTAVKTTYKTFTEHDTSYTSFFFQLKSDFIIDVGDDFQLSGMVNYGYTNEAWRFNAHRIGDDYQIAIARPYMLAGDWVTINRGQWYWIKVKFISLASGYCEWWVDGVSKGSVNTNLSGRSSGRFNILSTYGLDAGTKGKVFFDHVQITLSDHNEPRIAEASGITLTDAAGNVSEPASSSGSTLTIETGAPPPAVPAIASVVINPNSGYVSVGDSVEIIVTAGGSETGLTPSDATINGKQVGLADKGDGTYAGVYEVTEGDNDGSNVEATNITLTGAGGTSDTTSSSGSTLKIDAHTPTVVSVMIIPNSGTVTIGDTVVVFVTAGGNEAGLTASNAEINGKSIPLEDNGNGTYTGTYTVQAVDNQGANIEATNITLTDGSGNVSEPAVSTGSTLSVDTTPPTPPPGAPIVASVVISPNSGSVIVGDSVIITATAENNETGLTPSDATINGKQVSLTDRGDGTYAGAYTVTEGDNDGSNIEATNITFTGEGGTSNPASSTGSILNIDAHTPIISSVTISPNLEWVTAGDSIFITVTASNSETGLTASSATINGKSVSLAGQGDGTYTGTYAVQVSDVQGENIEAANITLTDAAGNVSEPAVSTGSTLKVDTQAPTITSVTINPSSGTVTLGNNVDIIVSAGGNEAGLTASNAQINGKSIILTDNNDGTYTGTYTVQEADTQGVNIEAENITLADGAGNVSEPTSSTGSTLFVDTTPPAPPPGAPIVASVFISPNSGSVMVGDSVIITATAENNETGLTPSDATINGKQVSLTDRGDGTYAGAYTVTEGDNDGGNIEATNITFTGEGGTSDPAFSTGSTLNVDAHTPVISSVTISPNSGWVTTSDTVLITVTASNSESGLTPSDASINVQSISLTGKSDGTYTGTYIVQAADAQGANIEAAGITLTDAAGNVSSSAVSTGSTLKIDTQAPVITSVTISPNAGFVTAGDNVFIAVTAAGNEAGLTASNAQINGKSITLTYETEGTYTGIYSVQAADAQGVNIEAANITLTDEAGNVSNSVSTGSTLKIDTQAPGIASVTLSPNSGWLKAVDSVTVIVTASNGEAELTPSNTSINGKSIQLTDKGDGTYNGTYTVQAADSQGVNIEAANITLTDAAGNVSGSAASTGSTLKVDTQTPGIASVIISPNSGWLKAGDVITITVTALNNESDLTTSNASINGKSISLTDQGNGTYMGAYTVQSADAQGMNIEAAGITLTDEAGNISTAVSTGSTLKVDTQAPTIVSAAINPSTGTVTTGDTVLITVTAGNNEAGLTASNAQINGKSTALVNRGDGTYTGTYTVQAGDAQGADIEAGNITLTDVAGNVSEPASSSGSTLSVDTTPIPPPVEAPTIASVTISPNSGYAKVGDTVTITVTAGNNETGLTPSDATINGKQVSLVDIGDGTYVGVDTVAGGDNDGSNVEAADITLTSAGGTSAPTSSSGSTLKIDAHTPTIESVMIIPNSGTVTSGDTVGVFVTAGGNEAGLTASNAEINGNSIPLIDLGNGSHGGLYIVQSSDTQSENIAATGITLTDLAGNVSNPASGTSTLSVLTQPPEPAPTPESTVVFIDEDLDVNDPYIIRDADSLFVADNDDTLTFIWNSWEAQGAVKYQVNIYSDSLAFENLELTETTTDTLITFIGEPGKIYCIEVIPMTINDDPLATLRSQAILCTAETPGVPGKPIHVIKKE